MELNRIYCFDNREFLKTVPDNFFDSVVTDPPYELGFMGKGWDKSGIAYSLELWREVLRVLKPGGHLLSFGGTRTYHRMTCAIEDAGFEIRNQIQWIYGSGFPKSLNIGKAVDQLRGFICEERRPELKITKGSSQWEGWGTALKPANEPICLARKPLSEKTIAENVLKWGTGGINVDGCRIEWDKKGLQGDSNRRKTPRTDITGAQFHASCGENNTGKYIGDINSPQGRFPANLIIDDSEEVKAIFPDTKSGFMKKGTNRLMSDNPNKNTYGHFDPDQVENDTYGDLGSASRFFYCAKVSSSERNFGLNQFNKQITSDGRNKSIDNPFLLGETERHNNHPTVNPIFLMRYLCKLITPPQGIILDPFAGSGSTCIGAKLEGFSFVGIGMNQEYVQIAEARIKARKPEIEKYKSLQRTKSTNSENLISKDDQPSFF